MATGGKQPTILVANDVPLSSSDDSGRYEIDR
jgi:hypothetical protein